jgi:hypothetical protein
MKMLLIHQYICGDIRSSQCSKVICMCAYARVYMHVHQYMHAVSSNLCMPLTFLEHIHTYAHDTTGHMCGIVIYLRVYCLKHQWTIGVPVCCRMRVLHIIHVCTYVSVRAWVRACIYMYINHRCMHAWYNYVCIQRRRGEVQKSSAYVLEESLLPFVKVYIPPTCRSKLLRTAEV